MIIIKYLVRETFKSQLAILFILLLIFVCQKLVRILGAAVDGDIPINLVLLSLWLGIPEMMQLILPLSLFLGLLMTLNRMYSEITVMHACGLGKSVLIRAMLALSLFTALLAAVNAIWFSPWSSRYQDQVLSEVKANPRMATLVEGQFKLVENGNSVLFVGNVKDKLFEHVFLAQLKPNGNARPSVLMADRGHMIQRQDGSQLVMLNKSTRYEGTALMQDFRITDFTRYQAIIGHRAQAVNRPVAEQMNMHQLWLSSEAEACAELHWRLTLVVSVLLMALMVVPLSVICPYEGRILSMFPAMLLYLIFFLLQTSLRSNGAQGKIDPMLWIWLTNAVYLVLALVLNWWDNVSARKLRERLRYAKGVA